ncbi:hypothetical protein [Afipia carboxidovorans]|uniref:hypothetical protein n=1 Tax=Afipia carboxidovorans TaxID=40137 RepID=UPI00308FD8CA|nr:hypothetical protein CRBSH125_01410 [Afipia carboxidovorans]
MLDEEQLAILRDIGSSIAFDDDKRGKVTDLVLEGYVKKDGDLYELTPKGMRVVEETGAIRDSSSISKQTDNPVAKPPRVKLNPISVSSHRTNWKDTVVQLTRSSPFVMLGAAFVAGAIFARRRDG